MRKIFIFMYVFLFLLSGCQSEQMQVINGPTPDEVVLQSVEKFRSGDLDGALAYFADDAVVKLVGLPPGQPDTYMGKEAIRRSWDDLLKQHFEIQVEVLKVDGDRVTTRTLTWIDDTRALGVAPLEATETYIVQDGKIKSENWELNPESQAKLVSAIATAQAPTTAPEKVSSSTPEDTQIPSTETTVPTTTPSSPPTTTAMPEVHAEKPDDIAGVWYIRIQGDRYTIQFLEEGAYNVGWEENLAGIDNGMYSFEGAQLHFLTSTRACLDAQETNYEVYVTKQNDQPVQLRFVLVGEDGCPERKEALAGKTLKPVKP